MQVIVTAQGADLNAPVSSRFGRCPTFISVETDTMAHTALPNPAMSASGGAGVQAAQFIVQQGAQALLTDNVGPNAMQVLQAAGIPIYAIGDGTVGEVVRAFKAGQLTAIARPTVPEHTGMKPARPEHNAREHEIAALREQAVSLRRELAQIIDRIEKLEKEN